MKARRSCISLHTSFSPSLRKSFRVFDDVLNSLYGEFQRAEGLRYSVIDFIDIDRFELFEAANHSVQEIKQFALDVLLRLQRLCATSAFVPTTEE